jgi:hypothetical protein
LVKEDTEIDRSIFTAKEPVLNAAAMGILTLVVGCVCIVIILHAPLAGVEATVEGLFLADPELEVAGFVLLLTREGHLRFPAIKLVHDLAICYITHLKILLDGDTLLVAPATLAFGHHRIAGIVRLADVAVDTGPAIFAATGVTFTPRAVLAVGQRTAYGGRAVISSKARWTRAFAVVFVAGRKVGTVVGVKLAVEAGRTVGGPVVKERIRRSGNEGYIVDIAPSCRREKAAD